MEPVIGLVLLVALLFGGGTDCPPDDTRVLVAGYTKSGEPYYGDPEPVSPVARRDCKRSGAKSGSHSPIKPVPPIPPVVEPPEPPVEPPTGKPKSDNSDANGKGGNKHDREDKDKPSQEIAEEKKGVA